MRKTATSLAEGLPGCAVLFATGSHWHVASARAGVVEEIQEERNKMRAHAVSG